LLSLSFLQFFARFARGAALQNGASFAALLPSLVNGWGSAHRDRSEMPFAICNLLGICTAGASIMFYDGQFSSIFRTFCLLLLKLGCARLALVGSELAAFLVLSAALYQQLVDAPLCGIATIGTRTQRTSDSHNCRNSNN
jgi:hypothetical protein